LRFYVLGEVDDKCNVFNIYFCLQLFVNL